MTTRNDGTPEDLLALEEVALLIDGGDQIPRRTVRRLGRVIRSDPRFTGHLELAEALARDAAIEPGSDNRLADGVDANQDFDRLLSAGDWTDPAEILDPDGERGVPYTPLIHIARARIQRAADPSQLRSVLAKLRHAALFARLREHVARLNAKLGAQEGSASGLDPTLEEIEALLRNFRQAAEEVDGSAGGTWSSTLR